MGERNYTSTFPMTIISNVNAINATELIPKNMQIMNMACSMRVFPIRQRASISTPIR